jgi:hypothetical protein
MAKVILILHFMLHAFNALLHVDSTLLVRTSSAKVEVSSVLFLL